MSSIQYVTTFVKRYKRHQRFVSVTALLIFTLSTVLLCLSVALFLLKSPVYALLGLLPLLWYRRKPLIEYARSLEQYYDLKGKLVNTIQFAHLMPHSKENYSKDLISAYIDQTAETCKNLDPGRAVTTEPLHNAMRFFLIALVISLLHPAIAPSRFWYAVNRKISYHILPTEQTYTRGEQINIGIRLFGVYPPSKVHVKYTEKDHQTHRSIPVEEHTASVSITADHSFSYFFTFLDQTTPTHTITVADPLTITSLYFDLTYPPYTQLTDETKTGRQILALQGTQVVLRGQASHTLTSALLYASDTTLLQCSGRTFTGNFIVQASESMVLHLEGHSICNEEIIMYAIPDMPPQVDVYYPGHDVMLPQTMELLIGVQCSDDYGLKNVQFISTFKETTTAIIPVRYNTLEDTCTYTWDLSTLHILPGDEASYYVTVSDNAGQVTRSRSFTVYFPTMEEIYQEVAETEEHITEDLQSVQDEHTREIETLNRIHESLRKERELSWADEEKLKELLTREEEVLSKIDDWHKELQRTIEQLEQGLVLDQQSIEQLQEISEILQEIAPEELKQALERFQKITEQDPARMQESIQQLKQHKEELAKALERTLELLQRYQQEIALKELADLAEELARQAHDIDSLSQETSDENLLIDEYTEDMEQFADMLEELARSHEMEQELAQALEAFSEQVRSMHLQTPLNAAQHARDLKNMSAELQQWYEKITSGRTAHLRKKLMEILDQLIEISKAQENLSMSGNRIDIEQQQQIYDATRAVAESLSAQQTTSMYITKRMTKNLTKALVSMERVIPADADLQNQYAKESMRLVNIVALEMLRNLEQVGQGDGSSTGLDQFLQQLADISQGQMQLNQSMFSLFPLPQPGMSPQQKAQLSKLAAKQKTLREALQGLQGKYSGTEYQTLMDKITNDMKESEKALYQYKLDRELIERQQKILTRLLDAQKSIRSTDYGKKRKSKPGTEPLVKEDPGPLPYDLGKDELRLLLQRALRDPIPEEYELYIREYFKKLIEEQ